MSVNQLSVFVENEQGTLLRLAETLTEANINIRALTIANTADFGILRLIVKETERAKNLLQEKDFVVSVNQVLGVELPDSVGGLAKVLRILDAASMDIEYMYDFLARGEEKAYVILRVESNKKATELLEKNGIHCVSNEELGL